MRLRAAARLPVLALATAALTAPPVRHFDRAVALEPAAETSANASLGDLDGDGDLDVVVSNDRPDPKRLYVNDGRLVAARSGAPNTLYLSGR